MDSCALWRTALSENDTSDVYAQLRREEALRGERFSWLFHWVLYGLVTVFLLWVHFGRGNPVGMWGLGLISLPLLLNGGVAPLVLARIHLPWLRYAYVFLDLTLLTLYNALDTSFNSALAPITTATLLLYPIILFLGALQHDRKLIVLSTLYCVVAVNLLFAVAYPHFDPAIAPKLVCGDVECQVYRTFYLLLFGGLLLIFPSTLARLLRNQKTLLDQSMEHFALAHFDSLTGLANRMMFRKFLEKILPLARRHGHRFALLYIDLDEFKQINDTRGHDAGDEVLRAVSRRLQSVARESDLAARLGGDEFVLVAQHVEGRPGAEILAGRILSALHEPVPYGEEPIHLGASIGIALFPDDADDADDADRLIHLADEALYQVKRSGKDGSAFIV